MGSNNICDTFYTFTVIFCLDYYCAVCYTIARTMGDTLTRYEKETRKNEQDTRKQEARYRNVCKD